MTGDPDFLTVEDVLDLHAQQLIRYGVALKQPFVSGNKRTALLATLLRQLSRPSAT